MNSIAHELKLLRRALALVEEHADKLEKSIAVLQVPVITVVNIDACPDDEYGGCKDTWYSPPEEM